MRGRDMCEVPHPLVPDTVARLGGVPLPQAPPPATAGADAATSAAGAVSEAAGECKEAAEGVAAATASLGGTAGGATAGTSRPPAAATPPAPNSLLGRVVLVHLNHSNPLWQPDSWQRRWVEGQGVRVGQTGMAWDL